ncbi:uncharacterized protein LOC135701114 [Ochlerotatus camptorhynchus]|uniref:uncharacterized protein LOC135701114 n=1 Tax=Ochlerotatus camptorhynchus TaxID=644619 RepID=UPI0031E16F39
MKPRKSQSESAPSKSYSKKKVAKNKKIPTGKCFPTHKIPRSKMDRAMEFLEADNGGKQISKRKGEVQSYACFGNIANKVSASRRVDNYMNDTANVLQVARHCALRGRWPELMKTVAILMEDVRLYDVHAAVRNAFYCIMADPVLNDPSFLEAYLYSNPRCSNAGDVSYCIDKILEVFQGVTIIPTGRRNVAQSKLDMDDSSSSAAADSDGMESSEDE